MSFFMNLHSPLLPIAVSIPPTQSPSIWLPSSLQLPQYVIPTPAKPTPTPIAATPALSRSHHMVTRAQNQIVKP